MKIAADRDFESALSAGKHKHVRRHVCAVGKIFKIGKQAFNAQLQAFYNVVTPHEGSNWGLRFQIQLLFPEKHAAPAESSYRK